MNDRGDYIPISCASYSDYEVAILHRQTLRVRWRGPDGGEHIARLRPLDLQTKSGEEFLIAEDAHGESLRLRLDWIQSAEAIT